jgi:hypothetical protein
VPDPVTYTGVLPIGELTVVRLAQLLAAQRRERRTRRGHRALGPWRQVVFGVALVLRRTRVAQLRVDNQISVSTAYRYLQEASTSWPRSHPGYTGRCSPPPPGTPTCTSTAP